MQNREMDSVALWSAWSNMAICSDSIQNAITTAAQANRSPLVQTLTVAMNMANTELDEIATEIARRGAAVK